MRILTIISFLLFFSCGNNKKQVIEKEYLQYDTTEDLNGNMVEYLRNLKLLSDSNFIYNIYIIDETNTKQIHLEGNYTSNNENIELTIKKKSGFECDTQKIIYKKDGMEKLTTPNDEEKIIGMTYDMRKRKPLEYNNCIDNIGDSYLMVLSSKERFYKMVPVKKRVQEILKSE
ncbi:hypothetical protein [Olleya namhaensis]|uniref:hypothetical protein n=1 Tax=Olleya namhaensis TaxID=1144750 RepID=UPI00232E4EF3|nr:hypothetical protein [Olleya namhaensis]